MRRNRGSIVASSYEGIVGVPTVFDRADMDHLQRLPDHQGEEAFAGVGIVSPNRSLLPEAADVDTVEDY